VWEEVQLIQIRKIILRTRTGNKIRPKPGNPNGEKVLKVPIRIPHERLKERKNEFDWKPSVSDYHIYLHVMLYGIIFSK
jgi:hypothetical protein